MKSASKPMKSAAKATVRTGAKKYLIGIDEVGRGPLAGPVTVAACLFESRNAARVCAVFSKAKESKQLSESQREEWNKKIAAARDQGLLDFAITSVSSSVIDSSGLAYAIRFALSRSLATLRVPPHFCHIKLDGGLHAPAEYASQETIIKGDEKELVIALASIVAKVHRDRHMKRISKKYPAYDLHIHKGYGTFAHRGAIKAFGPSPIHRMSFLRKILE